MDLLGLVGRGDHVDPSLRVVHQYQGVLGLLGDQLDLVGLEFLHLRVVLRTGIVLVPWVSILELVVLEVRDHLVHQACHQRRLFLHVQVDQEDPLGHDDTCSIESSWLEPMLVSRLVLFDLYPV